MTISNKKLVWEALEKLWYGIPLRKALEWTGADLILFFNTKRKKSIYIPAFDKNFTMQEYEMLCNLGFDLTTDGQVLLLIRYDAKS